MYHIVKLHISDGQAQSVKKAIESGTPVTLRLTHSDLSGGHAVAVTKTQHNKIVKCRFKGVGMELKMSKAKLHHNRSVEGGFIGAILPFLKTAGSFLLSKVLPGIASGALFSLGSTGVNKAIDAAAGKGVIYMKNGDSGMKVKKVGHGLFLSPWKSHHSVSGSGLYLRSESRGGYIDGSGLIFGENSPVKGIPVLDTLLGWLL